MACSLTLSRLQLEYDFLREASPDQPRIQHTLETWATLGSTGTGKKADSPKNGLGAIRQKMLGFWMSAKWSRGERVMTGRHLKQMQGSPCRIKKVGAADLLKATSQLQDDLGSIHHFILGENKE